jgi:hypothetical protein
MPRVKFPVNYYMVDEEVREYKDRTLEIRVLKYKYKRGFVGRLWSRLFEDEYSKYYFARKVQVLAERNDGDYVSFRDMRNKWNDERIPSLEEHVEDVVCRAKAWIDYEMDIIEESEKLNSW